MTFMERVRAMEGYGGRGGLGDEAACLTVEDLRRDACRYAPLESVALIAGENPERARNELKQACQSAFQEARWAKVPLDRRRALVDELVDVVFGMGPIEGLVYDESVTEIMVNGTNGIFFERDGKLERSSLRFQSDEQVRVLIDRIIGPLGRRIDESSPMVNARLPQGHRVNAVIPPLALDGPHLTIRAFSRHVITLDEMVALGSFDETVGQFLRWVVRARKNLVVSGGTGSGKTTLLNALSCHISHGERVITIEDSAELRFLEHPHVVRLEARPRNAEGEGEVTIRDLVTNALRMRPDRIIVGECRGGEALDMLQAMNTGHDGSLTTLHANSPLDVVDRMVTLVRYAVDLPLDAIEAQIGSAFDFIVQVARGRDGGRYLAEIATVRFDREQRTCVVEPLFVCEGVGRRGTWLRASETIDEVIAAGEASAEEVEEWKRVLR